MSETEFHVLKPSAGFAAGSTDDGKHAEGFTNVTSSDAKVKLPNALAPSIAR